MAKASELRVLGAKEVQSIGGSLRVRLPLLWVQNNGAEGSRAAWIYLDNENRLVVSTEADNSLGLGAAKNPYTIGKPTLLSIPVDLAPIAGIQEGSMITFAMRGRQLVGTIE